MNGAPDAPLRAATDAATDAASIELSLISHTNAGKTTLARTLLGRDVGEVRDAAHVTATADAYAMIETPQGDVLRLWDTPGFGDSVRLARRLAQQGNPIGWFLSTVWDRWRDRPFWSSQQAVRNVREEADVVLYLVNASEDPQDAGYVEPELQILEWIGRPVIALLNQVGPPRPREQEEADAARWRTALRARPFVRDVLSLDAFARCWVQEGALLRAVGAALAADKQPAHARLVAAWQHRRIEQFDTSIALLAAQLAEAACDREAVPEGAPLRDALTRAGRALGLGAPRLSPKAPDPADAPASPADAARARAMKALAARLDAGIRDSTDRLIVVHGLEGRAAAEVLDRVADAYASDAPVPEGKAAMVGGFLSGALSGLAADIASGGLSFGAGMLTGGVLGALGAAGLARGINLVQGRGEPAVRWSEAYLDGLVEAALLRYLAVAHYGRGRGQWSRSESPPHWRDAVTAALAPRRQRITAAWALRTEARGDADLLDDADPQSVADAPPPPRGRDGAPSCATLTADALRAPLREAAVALLESLYPEAAPFSGRAPSTAEGETR